MNVQHVFYPFSRWFFIKPSTNVYILSLKTVIDFIFAFAEHRISENKECL